MSIEQDIIAAREIINQGIGRLNVVVDSIAAGTFEQVKGAGPPPNFAGRVINPGDPFDPSTHYDDDYYADGNGLLYMERDGSWVKYPGPGRDWSGFDLIAQWLRKVVVSSGFDSRGRPPRLLSIGCGAGFDVLRFYNHGWDARGIDISEQAIAAGPAQMYNAGRLICGDITSADWDHILTGAPEIITAWDIFEHIWPGDIDELLDALHGVMIDGGLVFGVICTTGNHEPITFDPGVRFSQDNSWVLVSGHVNVQSWWWWQEKFEERGFRVREDLCNRFQVLRAENEAFYKGTDAWSSRHFIAAEVVK